MELFFLCTALSLHVLDHCMKLYWKRKTQRTAGPTDRWTDRPTDHRVTPIYPPKLRFGGIIINFKLLYMYFANDIFCFYPNMDSYLLK